MPAEALWQKTVTELASMLRARAVSPVEITQSCIGRFEEINSWINAVIAWNHHDSLRQARIAEKRMLDNGRLSPIDGIPVTIKDNIFVRGFPATWGSLAFRRFEPDTDDCCADSLRKAGAVIFGKTNTPEFALSAHTDNRIFGKTLNPWQLSLTPGGSSGGAAASVAAGITPLAVATDAGGSIRRPCSYTGLAGLRTTNGLIPRRAGFPALVHDFQVIGPIARTIDGLHALLNVISAGGGHAAQNIPAQIPAPERSLRIRVLAGIEGCPVDQVISQAILKAAAFFSDKGHRVIAGPPPYDPSWIADVWNTLSAFNLHRMLCSKGIPRDEITPAMAALSDSGQNVSNERYQAALAGLAGFRKSVECAFEEFDMLLMPASAAMPWPADLAYPQEIDGQPAAARSAAIFSTFVNAAGLPALSLPAGFSDAGIPIGMQLVGRRSDDSLLLSIGKQFEDAFQLHRRWPTALKHNP